MRLSFTVHGPPVPKARARVVRSKNGKAHSFTPGRTGDYEKLVRLYALDARCFYGWPSTPSNTSSYGLWITVHRSAARGDWDNFGKAISDACNGILWHDDRQISDARVKIAVCEKGKERVEVEVWTLDEEQS